MLASAWFASVLFLPNLAFRDSEQQQGKTVLGSSDTIARSLESAHGSKEGLSVDLFHHTASDLEDAQRVGADASGGASEEEVPDELRESVKQGVEQATATADQAEARSLQIQQEFFAKVESNRKAKQVTSAEAMSGLQRAMEEINFADDVKDLTVTHHSNVEQFFAAVSGFTDVQAELVAEHKKKLDAQQEEHDEAQREIEEQAELKNARQKSGAELIDSLEKALNKSQDMLTEKIRKNKENLLNFERVQTIREVKLVGDLLETYGKVIQSKDAIQTKKQEAEEGNITGNGTADIHELVKSTTVKITEWGNKEVGGTCARFFGTGFQELFPYAKVILDNVQEGRPGGTCSRFVHSFLQKIKSDGKLPAALAVGYAQWETPSKGKELKP